MILRSLKNVNIYFEFFFIFFHFVFIATKNIFILKYIMQYVHNFLHTNTAFSLVFVTGSNVI